MKIKATMLSERLSPLPITNPCDKKSPYVCSIPRLLDVDPLAPFEFYYEFQEPWWDDYDTLDSDFGDDDLSLIIPTRLPAPHYISISPTVSAINAMESSSEIVNNFVPKILSTIAKVAPSSVYKKKKFSMKRRRKRRQRKHISCIDIEPELQSIWKHSTVGDLLVPTQTVPSLTAQPSLPTINLNDINKNMLKRIDVVNCAIQGCSPDPDFYTKTVYLKTVDYRGNLNTLSCSHSQESPFGTLPAVMTDIGPVALPEEPFFSHTWSGTNWIVKAEFPAPPRDPGGVQVGGGRDPRDGRRPRHEEGGRRLGGGGQGERKGCTTRSTSAR